MRRYWPIWTALFLCALLTAGSAILIHEWPFTEANVRNTLQKRFAREVTIQRFTKTWFPPGCIAENVQFLHRKRKDLPPLVTARRLTLRTSYHNLIIPPRRIAEVTITGLQVTVPPNSPDGTNAVMPLTDTGSGNTFGIDRIETTDARLEFLPKQTGAKPIELIIHQLTLEHVAQSRPSNFHAVLRSPKPPGQITVSGQFGPWNAGHPASTPVSGTYLFEDAKLAVFHGLSGTLSSRGTFEGHLGKLETAGSVDVPDFHVDGGCSTTHLTANFRAGVDSKNGDVRIDSAEAHAAHSMLTVHGEVRGTPGRRGKTAYLEIAMQQGRVEDLLLFFSERKKASMTGPVHFRAKAEIPPGSGFLKKIRLSGDFVVENGRFTNPATQSPLNHLSESAQGEKKEEQNADPRIVLSRLNGHVEMGGGTSVLSNVSFAVVGASAGMNGTYNMLTKGIDIQGTLRTDGKLSDATTGFKALMAKIITPFLKKNHRTEVAFTIRGTSAKPSFALNLGSKH